MRRLQRIQNYAARLVTRTTLKVYITQVLNSLHWLRIPERFMFKILSLTYQAVNSIGPSYLNDLTVPYSPSRTLRSSQQHLLCIPTTKLKTFGSRSFSVSAATLWNSLPETLKLCPSLGTFKASLKTHLFQQYSWKNSNHCENSTASYAIILRLCALSIPIMAWILRSISAHIIIIIIIWREG